jgi:hypothetical protein
MPIFPRAFSNACKRVSQCIAVCYLDCVPMVSISMALVNWISNRVRSQFSVINTRMNSTSNWPARALTIAYTHIIEQESQMMEEMFFRPRKIQPNVMIKTFKFFHLTVFRDGNSVSAEGKTLRSKDQRSDKSKDNVNWNAAEENWITILLINSRRLKEEHFMAGAKKTAATMQTWSRQATTVRT